MDDNVFDGVTVRNTYRQALENQRVVPEEFLEETVERLVVLERAIGYDRIYASPYLRIWQDRS